MLKRQKEFPIKKPKAEKGVKIQKEFSIKKAKTEMGVKRQKELPIHSFIHSFAFIDPY